MMSVDLQEAYLHIPIRTAHRCFLRFTYANQDFQYRACHSACHQPPGPSQKSLLPIRLLCYLDDILILSSSADRAVQDLSAVTQFLQLHGFPLNLREKPVLSNLTHPQSGCSDRFGTGQGFSVQEPPPPHPFLGGSGTLPTVGATAPPVKITRENDLMLSYHPLGEISFPAVTVVPSTVPESLPQQFQGTGSTHVRGTSVLSLVDLEGHAQWMSISGTSKSDSHNGCEPARMGCPSSVPGCPGPMVSGGVSQRHQLAGAACSQACPSPLPRLHSSPTCPDPHGQRDCKGRNREGGTRSAPLMEESNKLLIWAEKHTLSLTAEHISGTANLQADWLSRQQIDHAEWRLHPLSSMSYQNGSDIWSLTCLQI